MRIAFVNGHVVTPGATLAGATIALADGRIAAIEPPGDADETIDLDGGWLMPGFVDTQVNGGGGVLFNDRPDVDGIRAIGAAHARYGTTGFLATLISDTPDAIERALDATESAMSEGVPGIVGTHVEGPFLNRARKGIHDAGRLRRLDADAIALLVRPRRGKVMVTLAPEYCDVDDIATLAAGGVIVSAGHSDADYETVRAARAAGLTGFTHLFNAMSPLHHRAPGMVGAALADEGGSWLGLIADGHHVHPAAMRIALAAAGADRIMLVTDAMPSVGAADKDFTLQGRRIRVSDGRCTAEDGTLAGSDLDMAGAVRTMVTMAGASPEQAAAMAATSPAAFLGLAADRGAIAPGLRADLAMLDAGLAPRATWIGGIRMAG